MHAYYRDSSATDPSLPHDSGRTVPEEKLQALGIKSWTLTGSDDDLREKFRAIGEEMGFVEGASQSITWDLGEMESKTIEEQAKYYGQDALLLIDALSCVRKGSSYYDIKDPETNDYIRFPLGRGGVMFAPQGSIVQGHLTDADPSGTCFDGLYKTSQPLDKVPPSTHGGDLPSHPLRIAYLAKIGVA